MKKFEVKLNTTLTKAETLPYGAAKAGCSFRGVYIIADYKRLVEILGQPNKLTKEEGDGKTQVEWILSTDKGDRALTIYDWKEYKLNYSQVTSWHVGGNFPKHQVVEILESLGFENTELEYSEV